MQGLYPEREPNLRPGLDLWEQLLVFPVLRKITRKMSSVVNASLQLVLENGSGVLGVGFGIFLVGRRVLREKQEAAKLRHL